MTATAEAALADAIEASAFADLYAAAPAALAQRLGLRVVREGGVTSLLAPGLPVSMFNRVIGFGDAPGDDATRLRSLVARYRDAGLASAWMHLNPVTAAAGAEALLAAAGLAPAARRAWAKMLRGPEPLAADTELQVRPATDDDAATVAACIASAFAMPPFMAEWLAALHGRRGWTLYAIADGGQPVGGACLYVEAGTGWLGMGSVLDSHRRRGGQLASMARRIADAAAAGCTAIVTETGEPVAGEPNPSLANMARAGFRQVASRLNFEWRASPG